MVTRVKPRYLKNNQTKAKKVFIESLGCSKNLVKSEAIASVLHANGYSFEKSSEYLPDADLVVINTCGFIKPARDEADQVIQKYESVWTTSRKVLVVGCYASRFSKILQSKFPLCTIIENKDPLLGIRQALELDKTTVYPRIVSTNYFTYLEIATGCSKSCSYCLIPSIQGIYTSKPKESLIQEMTSICENHSIKEVVLIAQDTASYGLDLCPSESLESLVQSLSKNKEIEWIRIMYLYPTLSISQIKSILSIDKVVPYLDIPLQHFSPRILTLMNRPRNIESTLDQLFEFKTKNTRLTLRSTFIVGFPGETEEDFEMLQDGLQKYPFDRAGFFAYSKEKETAAQTLPNHLLASIKKKRLKEVYALQEKISERENKKWIGHVLPVLLESYDPEKRIATGRTYREAPDVDPQVIISGNPFHLKRKIGSIMPMKIVDCTAYEIRGSLQA